MSKELDDAYFRSTPCTHHEPLLGKLVDFVDLLEERIKGLLGAKVYVGETNTLPAGSEATASASKRGYDTVLNFGIPKGDKGEPGDKGDPGEPGAPGSDAPATDVRIAGISITTDGVADIPLASNTHIGLAKLWEYGGIVYGEAGLEIVPASEATISARNGSHYMIPADSRIDYAVKAAMCDGKGAAWTAAEQAAAKKRMGLVGDLTLVYDVTLTEPAVAVMDNFHMEECRILITIPPNSPAISGNTCVPYAIKESGGLYQIQNGYFEKASTSNSAQRWAAHWYKEGGIWIGEYVPTFISGRSISWYKYIPYSNSMYMTSSNDYPYIKEIICTTNFPAGTHIEIYGR